MCYLHSNPKTGSSHGLQVEQLQDLCFGGVTKAESVGSFFFYFGKKSEKSNFMFMY